MFGCSTLLAQTVVATADEIKIMAGAGMRGAFEELVPQFERAAGRKIVIQYGGGSTFKKQIEAGEAFDLVIIDSAEVDDPIKQGKIAGDTRMDIVRVGIGVAIREGAPKPDISSVDAFKDTLLNVKSITYALEGSTGRHLPQVRIVSWRNVTRVIGVDCGVEFGMLLKVPRNTTTQIGIGIY